MNRGLIFSLALGAGFLGGVLSRYITPIPAFAQSTIPKEIAARSFVLMDERNGIVGVFKPSEARSDNAVVLLDQNGKEIWRASVVPKNPTWLNGK
jgi:hypothetical protein